MTAFLLFYIPATALFIYGVLHEDKLIALEEAFKEGFNNADHNHNK